MPESPERQLLEGARAVLGGLRGMDFSDRGKESGAEEQLASLHADIVALIEQQPEEPSPWMLPEGRLCWHRQSSQSEGSLVIADRIAEVEAERYQVHYIQFPERGIPTGGRSFSHRLETLADPSSLEEIIAAHRFLAARAVRLAQQALDDACADRDAVERVARILDLVKEEPHA